MDTVILFRSIYTILFLGLRDYVLLVSLSSYSPFVNNVLCTTEGFDGDKAISRMMLQNNVLNQERMEKSGWWTGLMMRSLG